MWMQLFSFLSSRILWFALHLDRASAFPKPLSAGEEAALFRRLEQGDGEAREVLIEHNLRLVAHIVKKYAGGTDDPEDLLSIGAIGLIKAVSTFSSSRGSRFSTYAARCIENEIRMHFRSLKKSASDVSINDPIESDKDGNPLTLMDLMADDVNIADVIDQKIESEKLIRCMKGELTPRERLIVTLRYGLGGYPPLTQREIAKKLQISRSYVSRIEKKAIEKLKTCFDETSGPR